MYIQRYYCLLDFEWNEKKTQINIQKHQLSFEEAIEIFSHPTFTFIDQRKLYGETRKISIGQLHQHIIVVVVHTKRHKKIRIISARSANRKERETYYAHLKKAPR